MKKKTLGTVWLGGCSGCHMSLLDIDERILDVAKLADIVKCPIVDGKKMPDEVDIVLVEGAVANEEHFEEIHHLRKCAKTLVAFGDCAAIGNVTGIRNTFCKDDVLNRSYLEVPSTTDGIVPNEEIAALISKVVPLHHVVKIDHVIPGCPPSADLIFDTLFALLNDQKPDLSKYKLRPG